MRSFYNPARIMSRPLFIIAAFLAVFTVSACAPTVAKRGNMITDEQVAQIVPGTTTREEVAKNLGTPTQVSTFDNTIWYYIGQETEQVSFLDPEIVSQKILAIQFTPEGVVSKTSQGDLKYAEAIEPSDGKTPTYGREVSIMQQLMGNLGRPTIPTDNKGPGGSGRGH
jgi:outer membrane protein assembly factor BamE (lipoprotein component of BamABCDE complex)